MISSYSAKMKQNTLNTFNLFFRNREAGLKLKESKCDLFKKEIHYLGHLIYRGKPVWLGWCPHPMIGTVYPNIPLSSASLHGHPRSSLGATLGVRMSATAYGNLSTVSSVWPIGASRHNLRPRPLSI